MNKPVKNLSDAVAAVGELPAAAQEAIARELLERVEDFTRSRLSDEQANEVVRRLASTPNYADPKDLKAFFQRHGIV